MHFLPCLPKIKQIPDSKNKCLCWKDTSTATEEAAFLFVIGRPFCIGHIRLFLASKVKNEPVSGPLLVLAIQTVFKSYVQFYFST